MPAASMRVSAEGYLQLSEAQVRQLVCSQPLHEAYDVEEEPFARGKHAAVRRCRHRASGQRFAAKFLRKGRRGGAELRPAILHEVAILHACRASPRIVRLHRVFESDHEMVLLLELAAGGELQALLDRDVVPEEVQVRQLMRQILLGLRDLHLLDVAHLDLKPQNLVLTSEFPHGEVKLCDLGISRYLGDGADIRDMLGTPDYVAPEVLNFEPISLATDMWSVGVLLYVLLTGCSPFGGDTKQETFCNISQCNLDFPDDLFEDVSEEAKDLMRKLMVKEPSKRLSVEQCLQHLWFSVNLPSAPAVSASSSATTLAPEPDQLEKPEKASPSTARKLDSFPTAAAKRQDRPSPIPSRKPAKEVPEDDTAGGEAVSSPSGSAVTYKDTVATSSEQVVSSVSISSSSLTESETNATLGMRSFRKSNFKKNMGNILERVISCEDFEKSFSYKDTNCNISENSNGKETEKTSTFAIRSSGSSKRPISETSSGDSKKSSLTMPCLMNRTISTLTVPVSQSRESTNVVSQKTPNSQPHKNITLPRHTAAVTAATPSCQLEKSVPPTNIPLSKPFSVTKPIVATKPVTPARPVVSIKPSMTSTPTSNSIINSPCTSSPNPSSISNLKISSKLTICSPNPHYCSTVSQKTSMDKECVYSYRVCFIVDDCENENTNSLVSDGTNESETSSGYYDNSSCCSSSDSVSDVSETSADLSGDRLSTASMDSLDSCYGKERHQYGSNTLTPFTSRSNVSNRTTGTLKPTSNGLLNQNKAYQFAVSTFAAAPTTPTKVQEACAQERIFAAARKHAARAAHTSVIKKVTTASFATTASVKVCTLNITRESNSNEVVLQEVKGGKCNRFSEVKIESVQSRIKKFEN